jgi:hypothetical protein
MQILLITSSREIPDCITHIGQLEKGSWSFWDRRQNQLPSGAAPNTTAQAGYRHPGPVETGGSG